MSNPSRPRPNALVRIDPSNAYARLGVSPLDTTEQIKRFIDEKRREAMARRRVRAAEVFGEEEAEMTRLQQIEKEIGTPRARAAYDLAHPQSELLTVQGGPRDHLFDGDRDALVTAWLVAELGREALLPSPDALPLWAPAGVSADLTAELAPFSKEDRDHG